MQITGRRKRKAEVGIQFRRDDRGEEKNLERLFHHVVCSLVRLHPPTHPIVLLMFPISLGV